MQVAQHEEKNRGVRFAKGRVTETDLQQIIEINRVEKKVTTILFEERKFLKQLISITWNNEEQNIVLEAEEMKCKLLKHDPEHIALFAMQLARVLAFENESTCDRKKKKKNSMREGKKGSLERSSKSDSRKRKRSQKCRSMSGSRKGKKEERNGASHFFVLFRKLFQAWLPSLDISFLLSSFSSPRISFALHFE